MSSKKLKLGSAMRVISTCSVCGTSIPHNDDEAIHNRLCGGHFCMNEDNVVEGLDDPMKRER